MAKCSQLEEQQAALRYVQRMQVSPDTLSAPHPVLFCSLHLL